MDAANPVDLPLFAVDSNGEFTDKDLISAGEMLQSAWNKTAGGAPITDAEGQAILALGLIQGFSTFGEFRDLISDLLDDEDLLAAVTTGNFYVITRQLAKNHYIAKVSAGMTVGYGDMDAFASELFQWVNAYCMARHSKDVAECNTESQKLLESGIMVLPECSKILAYQNQTTMGGPPPESQPIYVQDMQMGGWVKHASAETIASIFPIFGQHGTANTQANTPTGSPPPAGGGGRGQGAGSPPPAGGGGAQGPSVTQAPTGTRWGLIALGILGIGAVAGAGGYVYLKKGQSK
jgi:hypothetical protein